MKNYDGIHTMNFRGFLNFRKRIALLVGPNAPGSTPGAIWQHRDEALMGHRFMRGGSGPGPHLVRTGNRGLPITYTTSPHVIADQDRRARAAIRRARHRGGRAASRQAAMAWPSMPRPNANRPPRWVRGLG